MRAAYSLIKIVPTIKINMRCYRPCRSHGTRLIPKARNRYNDVDTLLNTRVTRVTKLRSIFEISPRADIIGAYV